MTAFVQFVLSLELDVVTLPHPGSPTINDIHWTQMHNVMQSKFRSGQVYCQKQCHLQNIETVSKMESPQIIYHTQMNQAVRPNLSFFHIYFPFYFSSSISTANGPINGTNPPFSTAVRQNFRANVHISFRLQLFLTIS